MVLTNGDSADELPLGDRKWNVMTTATTNSILHIRSGLRNEKTVSVNVDFCSCFAWVEIVNGRALHKIFRYKHWFENIILSGGSSMTRWGNRKKWRQKKQQNLRDFYVNRRIPVLKMGIGEKANVIPCAKVVADLSNLVDFSINIFEYSV